MFFTPKHKDVSFKCSTKETSLEKKSFSKEKEDTCLALKAVCAEHFNDDKKSLLDSLSDLIKCSNLNVTKCSSNETFKGHFRSDDMVYVLQKAQGTKTVKGPRNMLEQLINEHAKDVFCLLSSDLVYLQEKFSGTSLFEDLRKRLPGLYHHSMSSNQSKKS